MKLFHLKNQKYLGPFIGILLAALLVPVQSTAQHHDFMFGDDDIDADVTDRLEHRDAEFAMTTRQGSVDMMVTDHAILIQFSDRFMDNVEDEIHNDDDQYEYEEASVLADVFKSMITSGVRSLLDHALTIPLHEIKDAYYDNGRIYLIDYEDEEIFGDLEIEDVDVMEDFSRRDARRFIAEVERRMP